jgi:hypothetical protein
MGMGGWSSRPRGHHQTPSRIVVPRDTSLLRVPEWVPGRKVYPVGLSGSGQVKPGDLVLYSVPGRDSPPMLGIVLKEILSINNLFKVLLEGRMIKLISSNYLELL